MHAGPSAILMHTYQVNFVVEVCCRSLQHALSSIINTGMCESRMFANKLLGKRGLWWSLSSYVAREMLAMTHRTEMTGQKMLMSFAAFMPRALVNEVNITMQTWAAKPARPR